MSSASRKRLLELLQKKTTSSSSSSSSKEEKPAENLEVPKVDEDKAAEQNRIDNIKPVVKLEQNTESDGVKPASSKAEAETETEDTESTPKRQASSSKEEKYSEPVPDLSKYTFTENEDTSELTEQEKLDYVLQKQKYLFEKKKKGLSLPKSTKIHKPWKEGAASHYKVLEKKDFASEEEYYDAVIRNVDKRSKEIRKKFDNLTNDDVVDRNSCFYYERAFPRKVEKPMDCESKVYHKIDFANDLSEDITEILDDLEKFAAANKKFQSDHVYCLLDRMLMNSYSVLQTKLIYQFIKKMCDDGFELFQIKPNDLAKESTERVIYVSRRLIVLLDAQLRRMAHKEEVADPLVPTNAFMQEINKEIRKYTLYLHALVEIERKLKTDLFAGLVCLEKSAWAAAKEEVVGNFKSVIEKCQQMESAPLNSEVFHFKYNELKSCVAVFLGNV